MFKKYIKILLLLACFSLSACAPGPHLHVNNAIYNLGQGLPAEMLNRNLIATVGFDESSAATYNTRAVRASLYVHGAVEGTPEYGLRVTFLNLVHSDGLLWREAGSVGYTTVAAIPDHIERLKAWDLIEYRSTGTYRTIENFTTKQEGNIIVRVLCRRANPEYEKCRDALPKLGKYPNGPTGTSYPTSIKEYGYSFTPAYDQKGQPTRVIPEYMPKS